MIEQYIKILKEKENYGGPNPITNLAHEGSQSAFDALLELKRQLENNEIFYDEIKTNPYVELLSLIDRGMVKENFVYFKRYLNIIISGFPLYEFSYYSFFMKENNGFLNQDSEDIKIDIKQFSYLLPTLICKTKITDDYEKEKRNNFIKNVSQYQGCSIDMILFEGYLKFLNCGFYKTDKYLFDFTYLFENEAMGINDTSEGIKINTDFFSRSEMVEKELLLKNSWGENLESFELKKIKNTIQKLNYCYDRWVCWRYILLQAYNLINKNEEVIVNISIFSGWNIKEANNLSKIGEEIVGTAINISELGYQFLEAFKINENNYLSFCPKNSNRTSFHHEKINYTEYDIIKCNPEISKFAENNTF